MGKQINGPWTFEDSAHIYDAEGYPIAVMLTDAPRNNMQSNAALISAAPDLLQALEYTESIMQGYEGSQTWHDAVLKKVRAAIARARGQ